MFLTEFEHEISEEFLHQGYVVRPAADQKALEWMRNQVVRLAGEILDTSSQTSPADVLNQIHERISVTDLNGFRLQMIRGITALDQFREMYFRVARPYLEALVGNELAMQLRVNLSIQLPGDDSSLLPVHADTWSGDSPFEVVVWIPMVDCYGTKSMYLLPPIPVAELDAHFTKSVGGSSEALYQSIKDDIHWIKVKYGEVLVFNQALPHGNRINTERETRWSMNCRFKSVFTPYGDKKLGEFFEPISLRAVSRTGMAYRFPVMP